MSNSSAGILRMGGIVRTPREGEGAAHGDRIRRSSAPAGSGCATVDMRPVSYYNRARATLSLTYEKTSQGLDRGCQEKDEMEAYFNAGDIRERGVIFQERCVETFGKSGSVRGRTW